MDGYYSDDDSDSTVEETLIMLNLPQLNNDEKKLKNLNICRKKKGEEIHIENKKEIKKNENIEKKSSSNLLSKKGTVHNLSNINIDLTNDEEHINEFLNSDHAPETVYGESTNVKLDGNEKFHENLQDKGNKNNRNENSKEDAYNLNNNEGDIIPFEINSISLKNLFAECPECVINNKYKFKGMHTSSIGTNLYFKEPYNLKDKNHLTSYEVSYENINRNMKNENKITRDDFTSYEGYSRKIISFEIDC
ncbi:conserved Plasmodium protein, unknown function [Plasmodium malariae]|uniref:Uncharacterized protein n=1 Tax=Plasmodium malariae TaxID=5858 RepID=A0A1C3L0K1_PLAMA|nr:conserved Plasmodium protein, unknown function [Plasmodium malariae]